MQNLMCFENHKVEILNWNGNILFNPYHVGKCLDLTTSAVKMAISKMSKNQVVKLNNSKVTNIDFRKLHNTGENFLTESGVYKLVFKSRKAEAERFTDWIADEVLPAIRKTGRYEKESQQQSLEPVYEKPTRKTLYNRPVMITQDLAYLLGCSRSSMHWCMRHADAKGVMLKGYELAQFKKENNTCRTAGNLLVFDRANAEKILKAYNCFEEHRDFFDEYFGLEYDHNMSDEDMRFAVQQAHLLHLIAKEIKNPVIREQNLMAVTALLMDVGLWNNRCAGFCGISANCDTDTVEGWSKRAILEDARRQWKY